MTNRSLKSHPCSPLFRSVFLGCLALTVPGCNWVQLVSVSSTGEHGVGTSSEPSLSANGRFVAFQSNARNLVAGDTNSSVDIFVRDSLYGTTTRVNVDSAGNQGNRGASFPTISGDGRYVAFMSDSINLVAGDTNAKTDVFVHDRTTGTTSRVSVDSAGNQGNSPSNLSAISANGRYVAFQSYASNLVTGDTNGREDIFVRDLLNGTTSRVSVDSAGNQGNYGLYSLSSPTISSDGRYVAFTSNSTNLVAGDTNGTYDIFVRDRTTGTTTRVSVHSAGNQTTVPSLDPAISGNGRYVAFSSKAWNLVAGDTNNDADIFVHDRTTGATTRVSVDSAGNQATPYVYAPSISGDGRYVAFSASSDNLVDGDTNGSYDIFVHDRTTGATRRVSVDAQGTEANGNSEYPAISADGRYVTFPSFANNLVDGDANATYDIFITAIQEVTVTSVTPDHLPVGRTTSVTVSGTNFLTGATPILSGAQLSNIVIVNENTITMNVAVNADTPVGAQDLLVNLPGTGAGVLTGSLGSCVDCVTFTPPPGC